MENLGAEKIFRLGEQKLLKSNHDNQIQSITVRNMYVSRKGMYTCTHRTMGSVAEEFSRILC